MGAILAAAQAALAAHEPLHIEFGRPDYEPSPVSTAPALCERVLVTLHGSHIMCAFERDDDGAPFVTLVQIGSRWWEVEQVHTREWISALNRALAAKLAEEAREVHP